MPFPFIGEAACLGAALVWSCSISIYRQFASGIPAPAVNVFKNVVASSFMLMALPFVVDGGALPWGALGLLALSGFIGIALGDTAFFAALSRIGAQLTSAMQCLSPPITALIAALGFGEMLSSREVLGMMVTTLAVAGLVWFSRQPGAQLSDMSRREALVGLGFALIAAVCQGLGFAITRVALQGSDVVTGTLARILPATLLLVVALPLTTEKGAMQVFRREPGRALMIAAGAFAGTFLGLVLMSAGAKYTKAGVAAAITSTYPIWILPLAFFFLRERVSWHGIVCTFVAVCGIVVMLWT